MSKSILDSISKIGGHYKDKLDITTNGWKYKPNYNKYYKSKWDKL